MGSVLNFTAAELSGGGNLPAPQLLNLVPCMLNILHACCGLTLLAAGWCAQMGGQARLMSSALRRIVNSAKKMRCTVIFINQLRHKVQDHGPDNLS